MGGWHTHFLISYLSSWPFFTLAKSQATTNSPVDVTIAFSSWPSPMLNLWNPSATAGLSTREEGSFKDEPRRGKRHLLAHVRNVFRAELQAAHDASSTARIARRLVGGETHPVQEVRIATLKAELERWEEMRIAARAARDRGQVQSAAPGS